MLHNETDEKLIQKLGDKLEVRRIQLKMSEDTLVKQSGVSRSTFSKFKAGGNITLLNLIKLSRAMDCLDALMKMFPTELPLVESDMAKQSFYRVEKTSNLTYSKSRKRFSNEESQPDKPPIDWEDNA